MGPHKEVGPRDTTPGSTDTILTSTPKKQVATSDLSDTRRQCTSSQQTNWWSVHEFIAPALARVQSWPMAGSPEWRSLDDADPVKTAALLDAAQHWILRVESCQQARCEASRDVSDAADWSALVQEINDRADFYAAKPWLKRAAL